MNAKKTNKVALVTGSGKKRVGWHVARALAERGYGLVLHYRSSAAEAQESAGIFRNLGVEVLPLQADLSDENAVAALVKQVLEHFGRIDLVVNCAAIWERKPLESVTAADVRKHFDTN